MSAFALLFLAVIAEVFATSALKLTHGFTRLYPSLAVISGYSLAFWLMSQTLKTLPVSIVYSIWSGLGIVGIACIGVFYFAETFGPWHIIGTTLIIVGIVILSLLRA